MQAEFEAKTTALKEKSKLQCFCLDKFSDLGYTDSSNYQFSDGSKPCTTMIDDWLKFNAFSIGISLVIPGLNAFLLIILRGKERLK